MFRALTVVCRYGNVLHKFLHGTRRKVDADRMVGFELSFCAVGGGWWRILRREVQLGQVVALRGRLVGKDVAAREFSVSVRTVERWIAAGCPSVRVGRLRRVQLDLVRAWLREQGLYYMDGRV
jgi:excisionase family DNA binding protein